MNQKKMYINTMLWRYLNKNQVKEKRKEAVVCALVQIIQFTYVFIEKRQACHLDNSCRRHFDIKKLAEKCSA